jgi:hypothetical protein
MPGSAGISNGSDPDGARAVGEVVEQREPLGEPNRATVRTEKP